jgi:hypothetical protein
VGEMKLLNNKIGGVLVGSKGNLFSVGSDASFKIEDKEFLLGKSIKKPANEREK